MLTDHDVSGPILPKSQLVSPQRKQRPGRGGTDQNVHTGLIDVSKSFSLSSKIRSTSNNHLLRPRTRVQSKDQVACQEL